MTNLSARIASQLLLSWALCACTAGDGNAPLPTDPGYRLELDPVDLLVLPARRRPFGGAPLIASGTFNGYVMIDQQTNGQLKVSVYNIAGNSQVDTWTVNPN